MFHLATSFRSLARRPLPPVAVQRAHASSARLAGRVSELDRDVDVAGDFNQATSDFEDYAEVVEKKKNAMASDSSEFSVNGDLPNRGRFKAFRSTASFIKPQAIVPLESDYLAPMRKRPLLGPGTAEARKQDAFHQLGIDPVVEATNPTLLSAFVSEMGKVRGRAQTGLTWRSQRRLTKAIRRAKMMGVMPTFSRMSLYKR
ncbi:hypothetical protein EWM64_g56 [Hericium alpestre]|uniref:Small ribosomal subunit protein bS18m n=1 Tax=Hericium alpestre TaxID=135208 RepID=A0A4Z0AC06_9AGAM|nr:hypothetical protein EWM64_g56 [Hericium alpestre]